MRPVRRQVDTFSTLVDVRPGSRASETSWRLARKLSILVGEEAPVIDRYLAVLAMAPAEHLELLRRRGTRIVFAPTIEHALLSDPATDRRGFELSARERMKLRTDYSPESGTAAIFDPALNLLVFPTHYIASDLEHVVLHELGHALTMSLANPRRALLKDLPPDIERHTRHRGYGPDGDPETLRLVGREGELPGPVMSDLIFILSTVEGDEGIRFEFDEEAGRSIIRMSESRLIFPGDPRFGDLLAARPADGEVLEARDLDQPPTIVKGDDELALRRARRRAA